MEKLSKTSLELESMNIEQLKELFPSVVTEGKIDFDKLRILLGDEIDESNEKYQFTWHGKLNAIKHAQAPSTGTLIPEKDSSKQFETTNNLYVQGDNLEVLKQFQKTYYGKIKMIYIDPPYNTGKDFVYKDNFRDSIQNYKEQTSQTGRSNPETSGRYHTDWLNLIYPRLFLARNLLSDDGLIFVSIDHNELINLIKICDEIFGEANNIGLITIVNNLKGRSDDNFFATSNEFLIVCAKNNLSANIRGYEINEDESDDYRFRDNIGRYKLIGLRKTGTGWERSARPFMFYPILEKDNRFTIPPKKELDLLYDEDLNFFDDNVLQELVDKYNSEGFNIHLPKDSRGAYGRWRWGISTFLANKDSELELNSSGTLCTKMRLSFEDGSVRSYKAKTFWYEPEYDYGSSASDLRSLFDSQQNLFDYSKSLKLLTDIIKLDDNKDSIILDFFSGSATTAHAVMKLNAEDGGKRKFIMVQLPEPTDPDSEAYKAGYENICEIGKERIRRAGEKVKQELMESVLKGDSEVDPNQLDIGFKVFKLESTNIKEWDGSSKLTEDLLSMQEEVIKEGRTEQDVLYEVLLKYGVFNQPIETITINNKRMYYLIQKKLLVCLADDITMNDITEIGKRKPHSVIFKESGFKDDNVKMNALYTLERLGVEDIKSL